MVDQERIKVLTVTLFFFPRPGVAEKILCARLFFFHGERGFVASVSETPGAIRRCMQLTNSPAMLRVLKDLQNYVSQLATIAGRSASLELYARAIVGRFPMNFKVTKLTKLELGSQKFNDDAYTQLLLGKPVDQSKIITQYEETSAITT